MEKMSRFIQFPHPGEEHEPTGKNIILWNKGSHRRKFVEISGCWLDEGKVKNGVLKLWCEWEAESELLYNYVRVDGQPNFLWKPYWVQKSSYHGLQNTDPCVFGGFYYSICRQPGNSGLRSLPIGSVIVFCSLVKGEWVVDTVFVVAEAYSYDVRNYQELFRNHNINLPLGFKEVVLEPLCNAPDHVCGQNVDGLMTFYIGATWDNPVNGMFSFFPCLPGPRFPRFKRPALALGGTILADYFTPDLTQAAGGANDDLPQEKVYALWLEVKRQVLEKKLSLGISAAFPEKG